MKLDTIYFILGSNIW